MNSFLENKKKTSVEKKNDGGCRQERDEENKLFVQSPLVTLP